MFLSILTFFFSTLIYVYLHCQVLRAGGGVKELGTGGARARGTNNTVPAEEGVATVTLNNIGGDLNKLNEYNMIKLATYSEQVISR